MLKRIIFGALVLGALALYISQVELKSDVVKAKAEKPFAELLPQNIASLSVAPQTSAPFVIVNAAKSGADKTSEKVGESGKSVTDADIANWGFEGVNNAELDIATLNTLLSAIQDLTLTAGIDPKDAGSDKSVYGLSPAQLKIGVAAANGSPREILFGKLNEYVGQRYLQVDGDQKLYLVPTALFDAASKNRDDFRNRSPFSIFDADVKELTITGPQATLKFTQDDRWKMLSPIEVTANTSAITQIFQALRSVRVLEFIDDLETIGGLGVIAPTFSAAVTFRDPNRQPLELKFGTFKSAQGKQLYSAQVTGRSNFITFDGDVEARIIRPVNDYREKQLASFDTNSVKSVVIKRGEATTSIARNETKNGPNVTPASAAWLVDGKPGDEPFISGYFSTLSTLEAKSFLDRSAGGFGFETPEGTIEITLKDGKTRKIIVGRALENSSRAVGVDTLAEPFTIEEEMLKRVLPALEVFLEAAPASEPEVKKD